jgi:UDP-N-acetylglucosamine acyltransferase
MFLLLLKAAKEPLSYVGINSVGPEEEVLQRRKLKKFKIFTEFYIKKIIIPHKQELLKQMEATPERDEILDFIRNSSRVKGYDKIIKKSYHLVLLQPENNKYLNINC